jgi:hypothetical protein
VRRGDTEVTRTQHGDKGDPMVTAGFLQGTPVVYVGDPAPFM